MSIYPDVITEVPATLPIEHSHAQAVLTTEFENGVESRRLLWPATRKSISVNYDVVTFANSNVLRRFYESMDGPFQKFVFYFPQVEYYESELAGTAFGGETTINLPAKLGGQTYSLYRNSVLLEEGISYVISPAPGPDGEMMAALTFSALAGDRYTFTFTGYLKVNARFDQAPMVFSDIKNLVSVVRVNLIGLEAEI